MKKVKPKVVQVIFRDSALIEKFKKFVKDEKRSEANAAIIIIEKFFNSK